MVGEQGTGRHARLPLADGHTVGEEADGHLVMAVVVVVIVVVDDGDGETDTSEPGGMLCSVEENHSIDQSVTLKTKRFAAPSSFLGT